MSAGMQSNALESGRRPIVLVTDGIDTSSAVQAPVAARAIKEQFMIYGIGLEGKGLSTRLVDLIGQTGGGHFDLKRSDDLGAAFLRLADELHHQYMIGFTPLALDGQAHSLEVRVKRGLRACANAIRRAGEEMNPAVLRLIASLSPQASPDPYKGVRWLRHATSPFRSERPPISGLRVEDFETLVAGEPVAITGFQRRKPTSRSF
jgi:hypothetical protein